MTTLRIADTLILPIDIVTEKLAFLGRTGSGKTYAAMKLAELMLAAGAQIVALDPVGSWYGLRIGGNWSVYILGGLHGDFPLDPSKGKFAADLIADRGISVVLDISQFIRSEQVRFASDFIERFYQRKKSAPSAVHLFLEECQEFIPQNSGPNEAHMLHHFERAWKIGRNFGIGGSLISQRPQEINKKALNQAGTLFVFNMTGPQERKAIAEWTRQAGIDEDIESVLPTLRTGQPHVWSPTFLAISKTVTIAAKVSADVSMTPKVGSRVKEQLLTPIDAEKLRADMQETIEKAKADDPKELHKQISALQKEIGALKQQKPEAPNPEQLLEAEARAYERAARHWAVQSNHILSAVLDEKAGIDREVVQIGMRLNKIGELAAAVIGLVVAPAHETSPATPPLSKSSYKITPKGQPSRQATQSDRHSVARPDARQELGNSGLRRIMVALAQYPQGRSARQVGILAGLSSKSGSFGTYLARGRTSGWIEGDRGLLAITNRGLEVLGDFDPLPRGEELLDYWLSELGDSGAARILKVLADAYPAALSKERVGGATGLSHSSGSFGTYLSRLRTLELIEGRAELKASDTLFE
jgi:hypothetical protein